MLSTNSKSAMKGIVQFHPHICLCFFFLFFFNEAYSQSPNKGLGLSACHVLVFGSEWLPCASLPSEIHSQSINEGHSKQKKKRCRSQLSVKSNYESLSDSLIIKISYLIQNNSIFISLQCSYKHAAFF